MATPRTIAVFDIGKTDVHVTIVDAAERAEIDRRTTTNLVHESGDYPHFDLQHLWEFFRASIADLAKLHDIDGISLTTHGSSIALIGEDDVTFPIVDYEAPVPAKIRQAYGQVAPSFDETLTPLLPDGQNAGLQIFWLQNLSAERFAQTRWILTYPQYWAWRLTGIATNEVTSIGAHTHLWNPTGRRWSSLVYDQGWSGRMAILRSATEQFGRIKRDLAISFGLPPSTPVAIGVHRSNAAQVPHLMDREPPFTVLSTGNWALSFAMGGTLETLDPARDTLATATIFGDPVPTARFIGGREFEVLTAGHPEHPNAQTIYQVLSERWMVLPSVFPDSGPFQGQTTRWTCEPGQLRNEQRTAIASLYVALMVDTGLTQIGAAGPTIVEGPFADNELFCQVLASLTEREVICPTAGTGAAVGAAMLFNLERQDLEDSAMRVVRPWEGPLRKSQLTSYAELWRKTAAEKQ